MSSDSNVEAAPGAVAFYLGRDFGAGQKDHAIRSGAKAGPFPRTTRYEGYKVPYTALCGREVWRPTDTTTYKPLPWEESYRSCKNCAKRVAARAVEGGAR